MAAIASKVARGVPLLQIPVKHRGYDALCLGVVCSKIRTCTTKAPPPPETPPPPPPGGSTASSESWFDSPTAPWVLGGVAVLGTSLAWYYTVGPGGGTGSVQQSATRLTPGQLLPVQLFPVPDMKDGDRVTVSGVREVLAAAPFPAGGISAMDFKAALHTVLGGSTPHSEVLGAWFSIFDADGNGRISGREFMAVAAMLAAPDSPHTQEAEGGERTTPLAPGCSEADVARLVFDAWDVNKNGVVSRGEVASALRHLPLSRQDAQVIMGLLFPPSPDMPDRITRLEMGERTLAVRVLRSVLALDTLAAQVFASRSRLEALTAALADEAQR